jgi:selenocysteine lyase/cysteine desulfurase
MMVCHFSDLNPVFLTSVQSEVPYKLMPGYISFELSYSVIGILEYLMETAGNIEKQKTALTPKSFITTAYDAFADYEEELAKLFIDFLSTKSSVTIVGSPDWSKARRVSTISFTVKGMTSQALVEKVVKHNIGIRYGHNYAHRLIKGLGLDEEDGVVRVSLLHYNTIEEVEKLIQVLDQEIQ